MVLSGLSFATNAMAQADSKTSAREHFEKGVAAFNDRRFAEAGEEFDAAYRISPAFVVLYNIGQVDVALGRPVEAIDAFEKYLKQGASAVSTARRHEVLAEIEKQRARVGTIALRTFPEGAELRLNGLRVGKTPLMSPLRVNAGLHIVEATLDGHSPQTREVEVVGRAELALELTLEPLPAPTAPPAVPPAALTPPPPTPPAPAPVASERPSVPDRPVIEKIVIQSPPPPPVVSYESGAGDNEAMRSTASVSTSYRSSVNWQKIIGLVITAGGLATATAGGLYAYRGANQANDANHRLTTASGDAEYYAALPDFDAGKRLNQRGWVIAGIGAGVFVGGIIVILTAPERRTPLALAPWTTAQSGGMTIRHAW